jgi:hypothetical protein
MSEREEQLSSAFGEYQDLDENVYVIIPRARVQAASSKSGWIPKALLANDKNSPPRLSTAFRDEDLSSFRFYPNFHNKPRPLQSARRSHRRPISGMRRGGDMYTSHSTYTTATP